MTISNIEQLAKDLVEKVLTQMSEVRENVATEMVSQGLDPEKWEIVDNFMEVVDNPNTPYWCKAQKKIK